MLFCTLCVCVCVCVCARVCERGRHGHTTAACVQTHTSFITVCHVTLFPSLLELMVKLRTLLMVFSRDALLDRPVIGIGRFLASLTSCQFYYCQRRRQRRHSHAHTHSSCHSREYMLFRVNDSNFYGIQCKRRLIMYLCHARLGLNSLSECVIETAHTVTLRNV